MRPSSTKNKSQPRPVHRIPFNLFEMLSWVWLNDINTSCWYLCTKRSSDRGGWRSVRWVLLEELVFCPGWDVFKERGEVEPRLIKVQLRRTCRTASQSSPPPPPVDTCGTSRGSWWKRCWRIWMRQERKTVLKKRRMSGGGSRPVLIVGPGWGLVFC